uniref:Uncharacterized protein n=2 Tax=Panagrolaimus sp. PS1159 TaxID=55785 RepID=A0AC35G1B7_9BILA
MRRISGTQTRTQREQQRKYMEKLTQARSKTVEFNEKSSLRLKKTFRPNQLKLNKSEIMFKEDIKPSAIRRVGSSPRTGLMPAGEYVSLRRNSVDSESGSEAVTSSTSTTPLSPASHLKIPSVSLNGSTNLRQHAFSTPVKKSFSVIGDDVFDENAIELRIAVFLQKRDFQQQI